MRSNDQASLTPALYLVETRTRNQGWEIKEIRLMSLRELSLLASARYVEDFRTAQLTFSRGGLMAEEMDTPIRTETHGEKSLRDALRALVAWSWQDHRAFRIEELPVRFYEATGVDTKAILDKWMSPPK